MTIKTLAAAIALTLLAGQAQALSIEINPDYKGTTHCGTKVYGGHDYTPPPLAYPEYDPAYGPTWTPAPQAYPEYKPARYPGTMHAPGAHNPW